MRKISSHIIYDLKKDKGSYISFGIVVLITAIMLNLAFVLTILVAFAGTMFYNVIVEPDNFISTLSEEMPQIIVTPEANCEDELSDELKSNSDISSVLKYSVGTVNIKDMPVTVFACEDFSRVTNDLCYLGENPDAENEIALGSAFEVYCLKDGVISEDISAFSGDDVISISGIGSELIVSGN